MTSPLLFDRMAREFIRSRDREVAALALVRRPRPAPRRPRQGRPRRPQGHRGRPARRRFGVA